MLLGDRTVFPELPARLELRRVTVKEVLVRTAENVRVSKRPAQKRGAAGAACRTPHKTAPELTQTVSLMPRCTVGNPLLHPSLPAVRWLPAGFGMRPPGPIATPGLDGEQNLRPAAGGMGAAVKSF